MPSGEKAHKHVEEKSNFLADSVEEIKKVTWPTRQKAVRLTLLVLGFCFVSAIVIGLVDYVLSLGHQALIDVAPQQTLPTIIDEPIPTGDVTVTQEQTQATEESTQMTQDTQQQDSTQTQTETQQPANTQQSDTQTSQ